MINADLTAIRACRAQQYLGHVADAMEDLYPEANVTLLAASVVVDFDDETFVITASATLRITAHVDTYR